MRNSRHLYYVATFTLMALGASAVLATARAQTPTADQWRADLQQLSNSIRTVHPAPFKNTDKEKFRKAVNALRRDIPGLHGRQIVVRMAEIVAMLEDGHTRLGLPRMHPELGLELGHTETRGPAAEEFRFRQLPFSFAQFDDGLFVTGASGEHAQHIGHRVVSIGGKDAAEAMKIVQRITFAENSQQQKLMGADRLALPDALEALGIVRSAGSVPIELQRPDGSTVRLALEPLPPGDAGWTHPSWRGRTPLRLRNKEKKLWSTWLKRENIVYARIDEIADAHVTLAAFATGIIREAERRNARLVVDLRHNFGGSNSLGRTLALGLIQSPELNRYGRTFVLIGRRSFSATQYLINRLELYTRVLFAGEPSGARPDHFGDARKIRLENSGLTLRVSSLHWSSLTANDRREATTPDLPAPWTSEAYFSGEDPALAKAAGYQPPRNVGDLIGPALRRDDHYQVYRYLSLARLSPDTHAEDFSGDLLRLGREFEGEEKKELASFAYRYGLAYYPQDSELKAALTAPGEE